MARGNVLDHYIEAVKEDYDALTFGELQCGDKFIMLPTPGDNRGHGGLMVPYYLFLKMDLIKDKYGNPLANAVRKKDSKPDHMNDSMLVVRVE